ncbi:probable translation elongation factor eEF-1, gamma chain [Cephalotrichum gorgonifer]|uniref:Probable translation elongation factor eEF-1, gamma chain n=1 Tax=Cephalotrichum gorgonifer TaxID=2041049 RepID=A0AAE8MPA1_9PEZI|nr:probable translation elongation factor eEF-1, gamma chain [Cephalotrichum gorgonifer]
MSFGKLITAPQNPRSTGILAVAKANGLGLTVVEADFENLSEEHKAANPLGKIPTFIGADGYTLTECIAIAIYVTSQNEKTTLLGKTKQDYASILKWMSFFNSELLPAFGGWYRPLLGKDPYNKKAVEESSKKALKLVQVVEDYLLHNTFLVGERITLADLFAAGIAARAYQFFFGKEAREQFPNFTRWFLTISAQPIYAEVAPTLTLLDTPALTNVPPKTEKKKAAPKPAPAAAPKATEEEEPAAQEAPKPKHPCELLPKPSVPLDEFKRQYSNSETPDALKWFWDNIKFDEYSIWKAAYKYNDELTLTFMSNNLIGGLNARLEASRKYLFGCASVYGENNASIIQGAFVIRGQEFEPVFDVAPDYESYEFTKLDPTNEEDRKFLEAEWSWDRAVVIDGKEYPHAAGKVFK